MSLMLILSFSRSITGTVFLRKAILQRLEECPCPMLFIDNIVIRLNVSWKFNVNNQIISMMII